MESYILRIYRRNPDDPKDVTGLLETVGRGEEIRFNGLEQLVALLARRASRGDVKGEDPPDR